MDDLGVARFQETSIYSRAFHGNLFQTTCFWQDLPPSQVRVSVQTEPFSVPRVGKSYLEEEYLDYGAFLSHRGTPKSSNIWMGLSIINHPFWGTPNVLETSRCISFKKNVGDPNDMVRAPLKMGSKMSYHASWTNARGKCDKVNQWSRKWTKTGSWPCTPVIVNDCGGSPHNTVCSGSQAEVSYLLARKPHIGYAIHFFSAGRARAVL